MRTRRMPRWMYPGMHLKRWLALLLLGVVIVGLGAAIFLRDLYRATDACVRTKENELGMAPHSEPQAYFGDQVANLALP